jgi:hypothetical protein
MSTKKVKRFIRDKNRYKLTEQELDRMTYRGIITPSQRDILINVSKEREPGYYSNSRYQLGLTPNGSVMLNSVIYNGGESFGEPYHFVAEITHDLTPIRFKNFMKVTRIPVHPFKV